MEHNKLDNPVYHALEETHEKFALDYGNVKFYNPNYCSFGAFIGKAAAAAALAQYALSADNFYMVGEQPDFESPLTISNELICNQMILGQAIDIQVNVSITTLDKSHMNDLLELVNLVQPGYFKTKTAELGQYYGIYQDGRLVAAGGERMKMSDYTELSAIVTHPEHTGKGYASQLIAYASQKIFSENKIPYLHVANTNTGAIRLYEKLGFVTRRTISFWHFMA